VQEERVADSGQGREQQQRQMDGGARERHDAQERGQQAQRGDDADPLTPGGVITGDPGPRLSRCPKTHRSTNLDKMRGTPAGLPTRAC